MKSLVHDLLYAIGMAIGVGVLMSYCAGCASSTCVTVGECVMLPEVSDLTSAASCRIYTSINGARLVCSTNSTVRVSYDAASTNTYFGCVERNELMHVDLTITQ